MRSGPHILRTEAVVLRSIDYGETSRIVSLYTAEQGRMSVMARGARTTKNRFGSTLDPMAYIQAIIYVKPSRDLQSLTDAGHVVALPGIRDSLARIRVGLGALELVQSVMQENEPHPEVFSLLVRLLGRLNEATVRIGNLGLFFRLQLACLLGYTPSFSKEDVEALPESGGVLDLESGAIINGEGSSRSTFSSSRSALRAFAVLSRADLDAVARMTLRPEVAAELEDLVVSYVRYHFAESYPDRSAAVFARLGVSES